MTDDTAPGADGKFRRPTSTSRPTLVFLHGVGDGDGDGDGDSDLGAKWRRALSGSLERLGYPSLDDVNVVAPIYAHLLRGTDDRFALPPLTVPDPSGKGARQENRRRAQRWAWAVERRLGSQPASSRLPGAAAAIDLATHMPGFAQAKNYVKDPYIRAAVLKRVLDHLPDSGEVVIIGHSLGSVIAADLIRRLPTGVEARALITIGSPLSASYFQQLGIVKYLEQPPGNLRWWMNIWNAEDLVTLRRGISPHFPWMLDRRVGSVALVPANPLRAHSAVEYLQLDVVAETVAFALFGPMSQEVVRVGREPDLPLSEAESWALLALRFAYLLENQLEGDKKYRFQVARRTVQDQTFDRLVQIRRKHAEPVPGIVMDLGDVTGDPHRPAPEPPIRSGFSKDQELVRLLAVLSENVISPFEIVVGDKQRADAFEELTIEMQLGKQLALDLMAAAQDSQKALAKASVRRFKWFIVGASAAFLVAATGGLALAAAPGLTGAAAITSALASFGPGGMIGGLLTAGSLATVGGGGVVLGLANSATSPETFRGVVGLRLAIELARKRQGLESEADSWLWFEDATIAVGREVAQQLDISDPKAKSLLEAQEKLDTLRRARQKLAKEGLVPDVRVAFGSPDTEPADETGADGGQRFDGELGVDVEGGVGS